MKRTTLCLAAVAGLALTAAAVHAERAPAKTPAPAAPAKAAAEPAAPPAPPAVNRSEASRLSEAISAARSRQLAQVRYLGQGLSDPVARKLLDWVIVDVMADQLSPAELEDAVRRLEGWPREDARREALTRSQLPKGPIPYNALAKRPGSTAPDFSSARRSMTDALRRGDPRAAYTAIAAHGQPPGTVNFAEGESFAGWIALNKLNDPAKAAWHFARLDAAVKSPVSKSRAAYWRGLAAEKMGDQQKARAFFEQGAVHTTTFYGQLAAQKAGHRELVLTPDPVPTASDRAAFEANEMTRAIRLLAMAGERSLVRVFALHYGAEVPSEVQLALLVDTLQSLGEQEVSLLAYRRGAQKGLILHERGYPLARPPAIDGGAEPAMVLSIIRQESQFDPRVRSGADARGMMQILPGTGREVARKIGMSWSDDLLWNGETNMQLGSWYLGQLVNRFDGSLIMATAGYNAGPSRPAQWVEFCGDPRAPGTNPIDFIECIPFGETRNYVMNVMSNLQVYQARLNGGRAPLNPAERLGRSLGRTGPTHVAESAIGAGS